MTVAPDWERVESRGQLVYWRRRLMDGSYLAVVKRAKGSWSWAHRGPEPGANGTTLVRAEGHCSTSWRARLASDREVGDMYGWDDDCQSCGVLARVCGHRRREGGA